MAFYDKFPYTNYQELNLDWIMQEVAKVRDNRDASDASAAAALESETNAKASELAAAASQQAAAESEQNAAGSEAASAEYLEQIGTHTAGAVADWLEENLQPTTPPVDESLTVSGAAADAKVTGDRISDLNSAFSQTNETLNHEILLTKTPQQGYVNPTNGNIYGSGGTPYYYYITANVASGSVILYKCGTNESGAGMAFYNDRGEYISGFNGSANEITITVPEDATIAKLSYSVSKSDVFYAKLIIPSEKMADVLNNHLSGRTVFSTDDAETGRYVSITNGNVYSNADYSTITVSVVPNALLVFQTGSTESVTGTVFYDENGTYISGTAGQQHALFITIPENAKTAKLSYQTAKISNFYAYQIISQNALNNTISYVNSEIAKADKIVDINGSGDYTSILQALKDTDDDVTIRVKKGTYDIISEYEAYYGSTFFNNYTGYSGQSDPFYRGLWLAKGRKIYGESGAVISCVYDGDNQSVKDLFSVIANDGDVVLDGFDIVFGNVRYAIHDDYRPVKSTIIFRNINFNGTPVKAAPIGGGMGDNCNYFIENCTFENNNADWDINYHGSNNSVTDNTCTIRVTNCFGLKRCGFWDNGPSTAVSMCYVSNSKFLEIVKYRASTSTNENVALKEWCNSVGNS